MQPLKRIMKMKRLLFIVMAFVVLLLATGGDYARQMMESKAEITMNKSADENDDTSIPNHHVITSNIFNSVVQIPHLLFHSDLIFEFELPEITETKVHSVIRTALNFTKLYRTLFQLIISPNAP